MSQQELTHSAINLLKNLIETPSLSGEEVGTAKLIEKWFNAESIPFNRTKNNVWAVNKYFDESKRTLLLNSHHDTVKPNQGYICLLYTSPSPRDQRGSRMPSSA